MSFFQLCRSLAMLVALSVISICAAQAVLGDVVTGIEDGERVCRQIGMNWPDQLSGIVLATYDSSPPRTAVGFVRDLTNSSATFQPDATRPRIERVSVSIANGPFLDYYPISTSTDGTLEIAWIVSTELADQILAATGDLFVLFHGSAGDRALFLRQDLTVGLAHGFGQECLGRVTRPSILAAIQAEDRDAVREALSAGRPRLRSQGQARRRIAWASILDGPTHEKHQDH